MAKSHNTNLSRKRLHQLIAIGVVTLLILIGLIIAMIIGRGVWGIVKLAMVGFNISQFGWPMFISGAFISAIPGIILQLVLIPVLVLTIKKN